MSSVGEVSIVFTFKLCDDWSMIFRWLLAPTLAASFLIGCSQENPAMQVSCQDIADTQRVSLTGGTFQMGSDDGYAEEGPARDVTVGPFEIDVHEVTNAQFAAFVATTGYVTEAELPPPAVEGVPLEMLQPGSAIFGTPTTRNPSWWQWKVGAHWRAPLGPGSNIDGRGNEPVVHVTLKDAKAYAAWSGGRIPTAAQWEYAARGGLDGAAYAWGEERLPSGKHLANTWQGVFPIQNTQDDGYRSTAPIGCFPPNGYGLYDMIGNVWELVADEAPNGQGTIIKGGSFLCAANYCRRYRPAAWQVQERGLATNHIGFRTIKGPGE